MKCLIIQGLNLSNINKEEIDSHDNIRKGGKINLLFNKHNHMHEVVGCTNQQS